MKHLATAKKFGSRVLVAVPAFFAASGAFAAATPIDAAPITDQIGAGATAIGLIGVAVLSVIALAVCYKLIKKAF